MLEPHVAQGLCALRQDVELLQIRSICWSATLA